MAVIAVFPREQPRQDQSGAHKDNLERQEKTEERPGEA
jgi:hypothetical protein